MIRFADDTAVVSSTQKALQQLVDDLNWSYSRLFMKINVKKI